jgi:hypothetical protein
MRLRFTKKSEWFRVASLLSWLFFGLAISLGFLPATLAVDSMGPSPSIRVGDTCTTQDARLSVPILIANEQWDTRFQFTIDYDETFLNYAFYPQGSPWEVEGSPQTAPGRATFILKRVPGRSALPRPAGNETTAIQLFFTLHEPPQDTKVPFQVQTELSLNPAESSFFLGETWYRRSTQLHAGTATIYYRDGVEVGSGSITRRKQNFTLPLYLTYLPQNTGNAEPAKRVYAIGVDYDETFLRVQSVTAVDGTVVNRDGVLPAVAREVFRLEIPAGRKDSACRRHVADVHFRYSGKKSDADTVESPVERLPVHAFLLSNPGPNAIVQGEGIGTSGSLPGGVKFMPDYFVRGNTDSRTTFPQILLTDAVRILTGFFQGRPIPCADAADVNNNGSIEITDAIYIINFLYRSGLPPAAPFPDLGLDDAGLPAMDDLGCDKPLPMFRSE